MTYREAGAIVVLIVGYTMAVVIAVALVPTLTADAQMTAGPGPITDADSLAWVTVRVDSLNLGQDYHLSPGRVEYVDAEGHEWVYAPETFRSETQLPALPAGERWTEREREAICRVCLRHVWHAQKAVRRSPPLSEFERLWKRLVKISVRLREDGTIEARSPEWVRETDSVHFNLDYRHRHRRRLNWAEGDTTVR